LLYCKLWIFRKNLVISFFFSKLLIVSKTRTVTMHYCRVMLFFTWELMI
jgi:hypothetical protein